MPLEYPDQSYRPSAKCKLTIRFEEFELEAIRKTLPKKDAKNLRGISTERDKLRAVPDPDAPDGIKRFIITAGSSPTATFSAADGSAKPRSADGLTFDIKGIIPKAAEWKQNGVRTADQLTLTIRYIDMPFDPRIIRSCAVDYYLGCVPAGDWAAGIAGSTRTTDSNNVEPLNVVADTYVDSNGRQRSNSRFQGWVDNWDMDWSPEGEQIIKLECRDSTHLFTLVDAPSGATINPKLPVDQAVAEYLAQFPTFEGVIVEYRPSGAEIPVFENVMAGTAYQPDIGPPVAKGGGAGGGEKLNVWDYLTDLAGTIGHIIRIEGRVVIIQRLRELLDGRAEKRQDDPYQPRELPSRTYQYRTMIYGRNILKLKGRKEFTAKAPTNIEVRCYNPRRKKVLVARFPDVKAGGKEQSIARPGDGTSDKKWRVIPVAGIEDEQTLKDIAEEVYNSIGRNEVTFDLVTENMASFGGGEEDPDLLDCKPGDTIEILVNHDEEFNTNTAQAEQLAVVEKNVQLLQSMGFDGEMAQAVATAMTNRNFQRIFRVKEMATTWDAEQGVSFDMIVANYIEARADKNPPTQPDDTSKDRADLKAQAQARARLNQA